MVIKIGDNVKFLYKPWSRSESSYYIKGKIEKEPSNIPPGIGPVGEGFWVRISLSEIDSVDREETLNCKNGTGLYKVLFKDLKLIN